MQFSKNDVNVLQNKINKQNMKREEIDNEIKDLDGKIRELNVYIYNIYLIY